MIKTILKSRKHLTSILGVFVIIFFINSSKVRAQTKEFTFHDNLGDIKEPLSLIIYTKGSLLNIQSDTKGKISLEKKIIDKADSIFVNYSFYRLPLKKENFSKEVIQLKPEISLESVILKEKKKQFLGPGKKNSIVQLSSKRNVLISSATENFINKKIIGIRYRFKNKALFWSGSSKNKKFKVSLYGYHKKAKVIEKKRDNTAYNLLSTPPIVSIPRDVPKWVEVYFDGEEIDYSKYKYIAFGLHSIDTPILLMTSKSKNFEQLKDVNMNAVLENGEKREYIYLMKSIYEEDKYTFSFQLILK